MYQILKKQYRNYYVIEEHEDVADAKIVWIVSSY